MQRLSGMIDYVKGLQAAVHSESYVKHTLQNYVARRNEQAGVHAEVREVQDFYLRRVRANGALVNPQYFDPQYYVAKMQERLNIDDQFIYCDGKQAALTFGNGTSNPNYKIKWRSFKRIFKGRRYAQPGEKDLKF